MLTEVGGPLGRGEVVGSVVGVAPSDGVAWGEGVQGAEGVEGVVERGADLFGEPGLAGVPTAGVVAGAVLGAASATKAGPSAAFTSTSPCPVSGGMGLCGAETVTVSVGAGITTTCTRDWPSANLKNIPPVASSPTTIPTPANCQARRRGRAGAEGWTGAGR